MSAWIVREWTDRATGRRRREKVKKDEMEGTKASDTFVVEWLEDGPAPRKRRREKIPEKGRPGKRLAIDRRDEINVAIRNGTYVSKDELRRQREEEERRQQEEAEAVVTWAAAKQEFIDDALPIGRAASTQRLIRDALGQFDQIVKPVTMDDIDQKAIDKFVRVRLQQKGRQGDTIMPSTVNRDLRNLKIVFNKLVEWEKMAKCPDIRFLREVEEEQPIYTEDEFVAMYEACGEVGRLVVSPECRFSAAAWWRAILCLLWETGCRKSELLSLDWRGVDFDRRCIVPPPAQTKTKTLKEFSFGDLAEQHLQQLFDAQLDGGQDRPTGLVFPWIWGLSRLDRHLAAIQKAAGIDPTRRNLKFHAFRRTVGETITERYGLDAARLKLGHSCQAITEKCYARAATRKIAQQSLMPTVGRLMTTETPNQED